MFAANPFTSGAFTGLGANESFLLTKKSPYVGLTRTVEVPQLCRAVQLSESLINRNGVVVAVLRHQSAISSRDGSQLCVRPDERFENLSA
jgi:hypothetical protein